jgi:high affinity Mn2+ porin
MTIQSQTKNKTMLAAMRRTLLWGGLAVLNSCQLRSADATDPVTTPDPSTLYVAAEPKTAEADVATQNFDVKLQSTYMWQRHPSFGALYSGPNSLSNAEEKSYTFSGTAFVGLRLSKGTEVYIDPEVIQGVPFSGLTGLAAPTNGEIQKVVGPNPSAYIPRFFIRQTWGLGGGTQAVASGQNQLAGIVDKNRLVLTAGKMSVVDLFDVNVYAQNPRTQFMNWSIYENGSYDFAADARGFTWGAALEYDHDNWAVRAGRFLGPRESNGSQLSYSITNFYGDNIEVDYGYALAGQPGKIRLLGWRNHFRMGSYQDAIDLGAASGTTPDIGLTRKPRTKVGFGLNLEQSLTDDIGVFVRANKSDGNEEEFAYEEVDRNVVGGVSIKGTSWHRQSDTAGFALGRNELSNPHKNYLAAGGLGFFLGDGQLNYRPEHVLEAYYSLNTYKHYFITLDFQHIVNPGYNADRGPVSVFSLRLHAEL